MSNDMLWDYLVEESGDFLLEMKKRIGADGFAKALKNSEGSEETLMLNLTGLIQARILIIMCEQMGHPRPDMAYMDVVVPNMKKTIQAFVRERKKAK